MKFFQKVNTADLSSSLIKVNDDTFAEIIGVSGDLYLFKFTFKMFLKSGNKNVADYDRVKITIKSRDPQPSPVSTLSLNSISSNNLTRVPNPVLASPTAQRVSKVISSLKPPNGLPKVKYPNEVSKKLYEGLQIIKDSENRENFTEQVEVLLAPFIEEATSYKYSVTELFSQSFRVNPRSLEAVTELLNRSQSQPTADQTTSIDTSRTLDRINRELCDITEPITDPYLSSLDGYSDFENSEIRRRVTESGKRPLYFDIVKYYLKQVPSSPNENSDTWYETRKVTKLVDNFDVTCQAVINKKNKNQNLSVRFDLYKKNSNVVDETYTTTLAFPNHLEAYNTITNSPQVFYFNNFLSNVNLVEIRDKEKPGKVKKFNVYVKDITEKGVASSYRKVSEVINSGGPSYVSIPASSRLSVLRVIPVDANNQESSTFTNLVLGQGYETIGNLAIVANHFGSSEMRIDVFNVPKNCTSLTLYRRDCTDNPDNNFGAIRTLQLQYSNTIVTISDTTVQSTRTYEYYVSADYIDQITGQTTREISNYSIIKSYSGNINQSSITVALSGQKLDTSLSGDRTVSFNISTKVSSTENLRITETLKQQLGELYDQYLNPANNLESALGTVKGMPNYSDLFLHEVVRTNLNTGERETFDLVSDGLFSDNARTRKNLSIKPINPQFSYHYQVFTYKKNPIELFKNFVASGKDEKGRDWFYLPFKWKNASAMYGNLYADDENGIPIIDAYENYTSESFGVTATYQVDGSAKFSEINRVTAKRIDRNTVRIGWTLTGVAVDRYSDLYDSFVVMKVVNGLRTFVGRTHRDYIYHELTEKDVGSIYYIVVPIMIEFDIDEPGFSNTIVIEPDGLIPRIKQSK